MSYKVGTISARWLLTRCVQVTAAAAPECRHQDEVECCCVVGDTVYTGGDDGTIKVELVQQQLANIPLPRPGPWTPWSSSAAGRRTHSWSRTWRVSVTMSVFVVTLYT